MADQKLAPLDLTAVKEDLHQKQMLLKMYGRGTTGFDLDTVATLIAHFEATEKMLSDAVNGNDELNYENGALEERLKQETVALQERITVLEAWQRKTIMSWFGGWLEEDGRRIAGLEWGGRYYVIQRPELRNKWEWWRVDTAGNETSTSLLYSTPEAAQKAAEDDWLKHCIEEPQ